MVPCETNLRQQCQPDEEKNSERQSLALLTPALMGDTFFEADGVAALSMKSSAAAIEVALDAIMFGFVPRRMAETKNPFTIP